MIATENIRRAVAEQCWKHERSPIGHVSISAGVAGQDMDAPCTLQIIAAADAALYRAKRLGRNRVELQDANAKAAEDVISKAGGVGVRFFDP